MLKYYITESLGEVRKETPEGYLLCVGVPIARTGTQDYLEGELEGLEGDSRGIVTVERPAEVVFSPETMASFEGKPFTLLHPEEEVNVNNWKELAYGFAQNIRKDTEKEVLLADILITDAAAIEQVNNGMREISCGYLADYEQTEPGRAICKSIIGNHVALVPKGRAGKMFSIGDSIPKGVKNVMKMNVKDWLEKMLVKAKDEGVVLEVGDETPPETPAKDEPENPTAETKDQDMAVVAGLLRELISLLKAGKSSSDQVMGADPENTGDECMKTGDEGCVMGTTTGDAKPNLKVIRDGKAKPTVDSAKVITFRSQAEILCPGFDHSALTMDSENAVVNGMRKVLETSCSKDIDVRRDVTVLMGGIVRDWSTVDAAQIPIVFSAAATLAAARNNTGAMVTSRDFGVNTFIDAAKQADINEKFWKGDKK